MQSGGSWRKCAGKAQVILMERGPGVRRMLQGFDRLSQKTAPENLKEILKRYRIPEKRWPEIKISGLAYL